MIDNFQFLSIADFNPVKYQFKSVFQFRPFGNVFVSIPLFVEKMGWNKIFFISEAFEVFEIIEGAITSELTALNVSVGGSSKVTMADITSIPDYKYYLEGAMDLKSKNARIVNVLVTFPTLMACALYDAGMFGQKYVFLWETAALFQSNDPIKPPNCTEHKLAEILRSSIFITQAKPINLDPGFVDEIGMTPSKYDQLMQQKLNDTNAYARRSWFQWRAMFYSQLVGTALVLDETEKILQSSGSNISAWLTDGENFQTNGSFIRNLLHDQFSQFKYKGLNTYGNNCITEPVAQVGFHQMQQENVALDSATSFHPVPVAWYPGAPSELVMLEPLKWNNKDNKIPADSVSITVVWTPLLLDPRKYSILTLSTIHLGLVFCITGVQILRMVMVPVFQSEYHTFSFKFNFAIAFGNACSAIYIIILSKVDFPSPQSCSVALVLFIMSQWMVNAALLAKLAIAREVFQQHYVRSKLPTYQEKQTRLTVSESDNRLTVSTKTNGHFQSGMFRQQATPPVIQHLPSINVIIAKTAKRLWIILVVCSVVSFTLSSLWFGVDPLESKQVLISIEKSDNDDVITETVSKTCVPNEHTFIAFLVFFASTYTILLFRIIQIGFLTKHIDNDLVSEIWALKNTTYATAILSVVGAATIAFVFPSQPAETLTGSLFLALVLLTIHVAFQMYSIFTI